MNFTTFMIYFLFSLHPHISFSIHDILLFTFLTEHHYKPPLANITCTHLWENHHDVNTDPCQNVLTNYKLAKLTHYTQSFLVSNIYKCQPHFSLYNNEWNTYSFVPHLLWPIRAFLLSNVLKLSQYFDLIVLKKLVLIQTKLCS